ncbi:MAG: helix-turn-helix domain-containing protein [Clostridia bacterium]|nr:helix-turn-helix domain-containing protein [Clostridia bacterium]MBR6564942.1 helix-turn-helix domain-containing protein [Clostridia bacterium]
MDTYITGATIKTLREKKGLTQLQLANMLGVSSKAVSKWETAKGLPDITLIEPLANSLSVSVMELMTGNAVFNKNISSNMLRSKFYVCPVCSNVIRSSGDAVISCCGISLPPLEAEKADQNHQITIEKVEDEFFITVNHPMTKSHFISFLAYITTDKVQFIKFYPEGNAETRIQLRGSGYLYIYCNKHGLMKQKI